MPELPEVETTLRGIEPHLLGQTITRIEVRNARLRWPVPVEPLQALIGHRIDKMERRAKYILLFSSSDQYSKSSVMMLHLGMSGSMRVLPSDTPAEKHDHIDIEVAGSTVARFNDPRRFGSCLLLSEPIEQHPLLKNLGPEPLGSEFDADHLFAQSRGKSQAVKNFIMDNHVVVGVGNIYASESLHGAGIRPTTAAGKISKQRYQRLTEQIKRVLASAIEAGGTTLNDFTQANGKPGYFRHELQVYGRDGQACYGCEQPIKSKIIGQRNTFYCTRCQR